MVALLQRQGLTAWAERLPAQLARALGPARHGDLEHWLAAVADLPGCHDRQVHLDRPAVTVCGSVDGPTRQAIEQGLQALHPWRKGPYELCGVGIDTEWRSDWKWARLAPHLAPLAGRRVLDVGCGNGYHLWRIAGAGAALALGIDPTQLFLAQFLAVRHFVGEGWPVQLLPLGIEDVPAGLRRFDTVLSMGVLYHRRAPLDHLLALRDLLRPGGELVLETLVIEGGAGQVLLPEGRYAKMRNVWFIPSAQELARWLRRCGLRRVRILDVTPTSTAEQRATSWMRFESLADYLDPDDPTRTVEGHPAPRRAILLAEAP
jgi:tRNA (mo5U34)-methyltransferase